MNFVDQGFQRVELFGCGGLGTQAAQHHFVLFAEVAELVVQPEFVPLFERERDAGSEDHDFHA
jgi:hypothetical protein